MNVSLLFRKMAETYPQKVAINGPQAIRHPWGHAVRSTMTYEELDQYSDALGVIWNQRGLQWGDQIVVMIRPSFEFSAVVWSLLKNGMVPVFIDPGMGVKALRRCLIKLSPRGYIGEAKIWPVIVSSPSLWSMFSFFVTREPFLPGVLSLKHCWKSIHQRFFKKTKTETTILKNVAKEPIRSCSSSTLAAILFTSGGTGIPKGVEYTHGIFVSQIHLLQELFSLSSSDKDLPGFPLFSLLTQCMGMTSVIPRLDPASPSTCDPQSVAEDLLKEEVTFAAGSPAIWKRVGQWADEQKLIFPHLKSLVLFGAPVEESLLQLWKPLLPHGKVWTPYGATECLPVSLASGDDILDRYQHRHQLHLQLKDRNSKATMLDFATFLGKPVPGIEIKIVRITSIDEYHECLPGEWGEILVSGNVCTKAYWKDDQATYASKIHDHGQFWHRMGDLGFLDEQGYLWFLGRHVHTIPVCGESYPSLPLETFLRHQEEFLSSPLVVVRMQDRGLEKSCVVLEKNNTSLEDFSKNSLKDSLEKDKKNLKLIRERWSSHYPELQELVELRYVASFPVDRRHHIKIDRCRIGQDCSL